VGEFFSEFVKNAEAYGEKTAIVQGGESVSYADLIQASYAFGEKLRRNTAPANRIIPVTAAAGIEWFVEVLGIMSAGCAAVPISAAIPPERAEFILQDIKNAADLPDNASLIYYTSGSTGKPKGVLLTQAGIAAFSQMQGELLNLCGQSNAAICSDPSFDAFLLMSMPALLCGLTLYIAPDEDRSSLVALHRFLVKNKIDITFLTTQLAQSYMRAFDNKVLKTLLTGGEALRGFTPRGYDIWNLYGPCEATVYVAAHKLTEADLLNPADIPIGRATGENRILLIGGEICIAGPQLAAGYLNRPEETAERFRDNPEYNPDTDDPAYKTMYKTGDLAEYDTNGELRFRGRADNQVKISGYRIEPGEVEAKIMACNGIRAVKVGVTKDRQGGFVLNAVCVGESDSRTLRRELEKTLPRAMIPANIDFVPEIKTDPRTGKGVMV
jgi:fengycin family lipopeptide synthetase D